MLVKLKKIINLNIEKNCFDINIKFYTTLVNLQICILYNLVI
jgi:hypothetical protein